MDTYAIVAIIRHQNTDIWNGLIVPHKHTTYGFVTTYDSRCAMDMFELIKPMTRAERVDFQRALRIQVDRGYFGGDDVTVMTINEAKAFTAGYILAKSQ